MNAKSIYELADAGEDLLIVIKSECGDKCFMESVLESDMNIGIVGKEFPLLANISVTENISLSQTYHGKLSEKKVLETLADYIRALGLTELMHKRKDALTRDETIKVLFLRCIACNNRIVLLKEVSPYVFHYLKSLITQYALDIRLWVSTLDKEKNDYDKLSLKEINYEIA